MSDQVARDKVHGLRPVSPQALSPLVQLLPTGYRDIQPFQRGQSWHANGKHMNKFRRSREGASSNEKVIFPLLPTCDTSVVKSPHKLMLDTQVGPHATAVVSRNCYEDNRQEEEEDVSVSDNAMLQQQEYRQVSSPSASAIPAPPIGPRRPMRTGGSNNQSASPSSSFRTRAIANASASANSSSPLSASRFTGGGIIDEPLAEEDEPLPLDPEEIAQLWQEYAERTKHPTKTVDRETYHQKMNAKYNELRQLRERLHRLERELLETQRERDEARDELASVHKIHQKAANSLTDSSTGEMNGESETSTSRLRPSSASSLGSMSPRTHPSVRAATTYTMIPEELFYREKSFKLERALAATKDAMAEMQAQLGFQLERDSNCIDTLQAKLELEQRACKLVAQQLLEANTSFKVAVDELVITQRELEKEQIHKQIVLEQLRTETQQLMSDHRRKELQSRVKTAVRNMGKQALHQKMEALQTRVLVAEHNMRCSQMEAERLKRESKILQQQLEQILSSSAIKYHTLANDGGVPGILQRSTSLYRGSRIISGQYFMLQILYEDDRSASTPEQNSESDDSGDIHDDFRMHFIAYEAMTAQDDYLTFHLRDIQQLVPDHAKFLAPHEVRKRERFQGLAELLLQHVHIGYKNGHVILTQSPASNQMAIMVATAATHQNEQNHEVVIYRSTQFLPFISEAREDTVLVDLTITEVYRPSESDLWWLEIHAVTLESGSDVEDIFGVGVEISVKIDYPHLRDFCAHIGSYRPSECMHINKPTSESNAATITDNIDEMFGIHEELLGPILDKLAIVKNDVDQQASMKLTILDAAVPFQPGNDITDRPESDINDDASTRSPILQEEDNSPRLDSVIDVASVLDHRCIVNIDEAFYCMRIQELWDGELMLVIHMEDIDAMQQFHCVLSERQLIAIAAHLVRSEGLTENAASNIKYGLDPSLHRPICKLLKKHVRPIPSGAAATVKANIVREISIASLMNELASKSNTMVDINSSVQASRQWEHVNVIGGHLPENAIQKLLSQLDDPTVRQRRHRRGVRCGSTTLFVVVDIYSQLPDFDGSVVHIFQVGEYLGTNSREMVLIFTLPLKDDDYSETLDLLATTIPEVIANRNENKS